MSICVAIIMKQIIILTNKTNENDKFNMKSRGHSLYCSAAQCLPKVRIHPGKLPGATSNL